LVLGFSAVFQNPGASENNAFRNENVIYLGLDKDGKKLFFGHGIGIKTEAEIIKALEENRDDDPKKQVKLVVMLTDTTKVPDRR
jgi:hypothetical protein